MNSNSHHSSCSFSDLLVSYLYDEIGETEKSRFESHVSNCRACADEVFAFGGVRSSLNDWRETEFAKIPTPVFELPFEPEKIAFPTETLQASRSWLASARELFSLSPVWAGAATACAALAICAGLFYVAFSSQQSDKNIAEANKNISTSVVPSPTVDHKSANSEETGNVKQSDETPKPELAGDKKQNSPKPSLAAEKTVVSDKPELKLIKTSVAPKPAVKEKTPSNGKKASKPSDLEFTTREEEDKSLRLADLFDEVSMR